MSQPVWALPDGSGHTVEGGQQEVDGQNGSYQPTPVVTQPGPELGDVHLLHKPKPASAGWPAGFSSSAPIAMEYGARARGAREWEGSGVGFFFARPGRMGGRPPPPLPQPTPGQRRELRSAWDQ